MNGALILLIVVVSPYFVVNLIRLYRGKRWALGVCSFAKEWEQREHDKRIAARAAKPVTTAPRRP